MRFSREYLDRLLDETLGLINVPEGGSVTLEGSIAEGFGNDTSDVDFLVLDDKDGEWPRMPTILFVRGHRVEVRVIAVKELLHEANTLRGLWKAGRRGLVRIDEERLDRCQRLSRGVVLRNPELVGAVRRVLPAGDLERLIAEWFTLHSRASYRCAVAMSELGRELEAASWARSAMTQGAKSWLAQRGETYLAKKWISEQLTRTSGGEHVKSRMLQMESAASAGCGSTAYLREVAEFLLGVGVDGCWPEPSMVALRRKRYVTTWQLGSRVHVVRRRHDVFGLGADAARIWRSLAFAMPLPSVLAGIEASCGFASDVAGKIIAEFHRLGLVGLQWRGGAEIGSRRVSGLGPASGRPVVCLEGIVFSEQENAVIKLAPVAARRFAAAGMELAWVNIVIENAREDAVGALRAGQWHVFERSVRRMLRHACMAALSAAGVHPLPAAEEVHLHLAAVDTVPSGLRTRIVELERGLRVDEESVGRATLDTVDQLTAEIREVTKTEVFPACFESTEEWQRALDIGYDWVRLGAYLAAAFPVDQARELLSTGGKQPQDQRGERLTQVDGSGTSHQAISVGR